MRSLLAALAATLFFPAVAHARSYSNTQVALPNNLHLVDLNGDGIDDWVLWKGRQLFAARTNFQAEGYAYDYVASAPARAFVGYFKDGPSGQACLIPKKNSARLACYQLHNDHDAFTVAWTQPNFIGPKEEAIVGDFTGDGRDDVLVYAPGKGTFELWEKGTRRFVKAEASAFVPGALADGGLKHKLILAGNFGDVSGDGTRTDLLVFNRTRRRLTRINARKHGADGVTFVSDFTTRDDFVNANETPTVASVRGLGFEEIVLNPGLGAFRFFVPALGSSGDLQSFTQGVGDLSPAMGRELFWGDLKQLTSGTTNDNKRDDVILYSDALKRLQFNLARWDSTAGRSFELVMVQPPLDLDADQDGDAIITRHELGGYDRNRNGTSTEPLHHYGASPFVKDVFVEVDYMEKWGTFDGKPVVVKSLKMQEAAANIAIEEMAKHGINLHIFIDDAIGYQEVLGSGTGPFDWEANFDPIKDANFTRSRWRFFHYAVFADSFISSYSGVSRGIEGSDFLVTLGRWDDYGGTTYEQAGTFLHELGHNLGLRHGGRDNVNHKPNHLSVMNYDYQTVGIQKEGESQFLFSEMSCTKLDENRLDESEGVQCETGSTAYETFVYGRGRWFPLNAPIDFNGSGAFTSNVRANVNLDVDNDANARYQILKGGRDEYAAMTFDGGLIGKDLNDAVDATTSSGAAKDAHPSRKVRKRLQRTTNASDELDLTLEKAVRKRRPKRKMRDLKTLRAPLRKFQVLADSQVPAGAKAKLVGSKMPPRKRKAGTRTVAPRKVAKKRRTRKTGRPTTRKKKK